MDEIVVLAVQITNDDDGFSALHHIRFLLCCETCLTQVESKLTEDVYCVFEQLHSQVLANYALF